MKLTDFNPSTEKETNNRLIRIDWNLMFIVCVFGILGSCFMYDAYQEQESKNTIVIAKGNS